jgi:aminoacylase
MLVHCPGTTGHGSALLPDTAGEKVRIIIDHFMDFREQEKKKLDSDPSLTLGDVTTVNLTQLKVIISVLLHKHGFKV